MTRSILLGTIIAASSLTSCSSAEREASGAALLMVVDKSGSMAGDPIRHIRTACLTAFDELRPGDYAGVLAFDVRARWVVPLARVDGTPDFKASVNRLKADGGLRLDAGLDEALRAFRSNGETRAVARRHIILVSDGDAPESQVEKTVRDLAQEGVSVSAVCLNSGTFDAARMQRLAELGGGRFKFADSPGPLPMIFASEVRRLLRN